MKKLVGIRLSCMIIVIFLVGLIGFTPSTSLGKKTGGSSCPKDSTGIFIAVYDGDIDKVKDLLDKGVSPNQTNECDPILTFASASGEVEIVKLLLDRGADINIRDLEGVTPLIFAAAMGSLECVKILIQRGADINAQDEKGYTALIVAAEGTAIEDTQKGKAVSFQIVKILLDNGADFKIKTEKGITALRVAKEFGNHDVVNLLIQCGAKE